MQLTAGIFVASFWISMATAQQNDYTITHWGDGSAMGCSYRFEPTAVVPWSGEGQPPVTVEQVNRIVSDWVAANNLTLVTINDYRLASTYDFRSPGRRTPVQAWFLKLLAIPAGTRTPFAFGSGERQLAIAFNGSVIEPECN